MLTSLLYIIMLFMILWASQISTIYKNQGTTEGKKRPMITKFLIIQQKIDKKMPKTSKNSMGYNRVTFSIEIEGGLFEIKGGGPIYGCSNFWSWFRPTETPGVHTSVEGTNEIYLPHLFLQDQMKLILKCAPFQINNTLYIYTVPCIYVRTQFFSPNSI